MSDWKLKIDVQQPSVKGAERALKKLFKELDRIDKVANKAENALEDMADKVEKLKPKKGLSFKDIVGANFVANVGSRGAAGAVNALTKSIGLYTQSVRRAVADAAAFENSIVSIARISGSTEQSIAAMSNEFRVLSTRVPVGVKEFQKFAETASRFGIKGSEGIKQFAQTFGRLQSIIGPVSEETAKSVSRIASITGFPIEEIDKFANSVVILGKNFATSEEQIVRTAERIAQDTSSFGASAEQVLGLSTALDALGIKAEKGGSALLRVLDAIQSKAIQGNDDFTRLVELSGDTFDSFKSLSIAAPIKAFERLVSSGAAGSEIMDRLGLAGVRVQSVLAALTKKSDLFTKSMSDASKGMKNNNVLLKDSERQGSTVGNKMIRLGNAFESAFIGIGSSATDQTSELLDTILEMTDAFVGLEGSASEAFPGIAKLGKSTKELFSESINSIGKFFDSFEENSGAIDKVFEKAKDLLGVAQELVPVITKIAGFGADVAVGGANLAGVGSKNDVQLARAAYIDSVTKFFTLGFGGTNFVDADIERIGAEADFKTAQRRQDRIESEKKARIAREDAEFEPLGLKPVNKGFNANEGWETRIDDAIRSYKKSDSIKEFDAAEAAFINAIIVGAEKITESLRSPADRFSKDAKNISFENNLKDQGLDERDKQIARISRTSGADFDKLLRAESNILEQIEAFKGDTSPEGLKASSELKAAGSEIGKFIEKFQKSFNDKVGAIEVSGLIDDIKAWDKEIERTKTSISKLDDRLGEINKTTPQVRAITDVVSAGKFISDSREAEKRTKEKAEEIQIAKDIRKATLDNLEVNKKKARVKIAKIRGGA